MNIIQANILSLLILFPAVFAIIFLATGKKYLKAIFPLAVILTVIEFVASLFLWFNFVDAEASLQFVEKSTLIKSFNIQWYLGIDGISLLLILLTTFTMPLVLLSGKNSVKEDVHKYLGFFLLLESAVIGALCIQDLMLFYLFWELMLVPMFFIIGVWGGPKKIYASIKFLLFTMAGSLPMLAAIVYLNINSAQVTGIGTFSLPELANLNVGLTESYWLFAAFALAFAVKVPLFPLHTWLPDAHVEAPTGGSVILAGVLLKLGIYGFIRIAFPLFPAAAVYFAPLFILFGVIGIVYGALLAMVQKDIKKLVAYSSVSHMGYIILGIFVFNIQGMQGGIIQMLNHGLSTGMLFLLIGMIYERRHTRDISEFGGLAKSIPIFSVFFMIATLSSIGLPGLNGFVGEFLILLGAFEHVSPSKFIAVSGLVFGAVYMLWMYQRVVFGPLKNDKNKNLKDLNLRELIIVIPIVAFMVFIGLYPKPFLSKSEPAAKQLIEKIQKVNYNSNIKQIFIGDK